MRIKSFFFLLLLFFCFCSCDYFHSVPLYIYYTNDIHGYIYPVLASSRDSVCYIGGFSVAKNYINNMHRPYLIFDAGDFFQGTPEGNYKGGKFVVEIMNMVGYNFCTPGNHEFDYGYENFLELEKEAKFRFLCANIIDTLEMRTPSEFTPLDTITLNGVKIGIFGLITPQTIYITNFNAPYKIEQPEISSSEAIKTLKGYGAQVIIALTHLGFNDDKELCRNVEGIDVVIGGHSHTYIRKPIKVGETYIVQAGSQLKCLGQLCILYNKKKNKVVAVRNWLIPLYRNKWGEDIFIKRKVDELVQMVGVELDSVIGVAESDITRETINGRESLLGNLIADIMREWAKTDIAFQNSGGIRADIRKGKITKRNIYNVQPFDNTAVIMQFSGAEIESIMKQSFENPYGGLQISGLTVHYRVNNGKPEILSLYVNNEPLDRSKDYTVCTNSYLAYGGEGYNLNKIGKIIKDTGINLRDIIIDYVRNKGKLVAGEKGRYIKE